MNEEKLRSEAAIALFNALRPNHMATAEAYQTLSDVQLDLDKNDEAYENYQRAYLFFLLIAIISGIIQL